MCKWIVLCCTHYQVLSSVADQGSFSLPPCYTCIAVYTCVHANHHQTTVHVHVQCTLYMHVVRTLQYHTRTLGDPAS